MSTALAFALLLALCAQCGLAARIAADGAVVVQQLEHLATFSDTGPATVKGVTRILFTKTDVEARG